MGYFLRVNHPGAYFMARLYIVFLLLLISCGLRAQSDSIRPPQTSIAKSQDTTPSTIRHDSAVRHLSHRDSVRHDSVVRAHRAIRDSIRRVQNKAHQDSLAAPTTPGTAPPTPGTPAGTRKPDSTAAGRPAVSSS